MDQRVRGIGAGRGGVTFMGPRRRDARRRGAARAPTHTHTPARVCVCARAWMALVSCVLPPSAASCGRAHASDRCRRARGASERAIARSDLVRPLWACAARGMRGKPPRFPLVLPSCLSLPSFRLFIPSRPSSRFPLVLPSRPSPRFPFVLRLGAEARGCRPPQIGPV